MKVIITRKIYSLASRQKKHGKLCLRRVYNSINVVTTITITITTPAESEQTRCKQIR